MAPDEKHMEEKPSPLGRLYAEVIIPLYLPRNYTWSVPPHLVSKVQPGVRVEVVLGKNKKYAGIVRSLSPSPPGAYETKDILNVLDPEPILFHRQLQLWDWIASYYACTEGEVMAAALPAHFKLSSETILIYLEEYGDDFSALDHEEYLVAEALLLRKELKITEIQEILDSSHVYPVIRKLIDARVCVVWESIKDTYKPKTESVVQIEPLYSSEEQLSALINNWGKAPRQMELLLAFLHFQRTEGTVRKKDLLEKSGSTEAQLKGLVEKGILRVEKKQVGRLPVLPRSVNIDFELTPHQREVITQLQDQMRSHAVSLLHGVTSGGKTNLYIKLIEACLQQGKQVLYLLPEIALTAQIIRRLQRHFGGHIGIYHSKFSQNERIELWNRLQSGELRVILGARSALFLPFSDLGLVIVDEEHDSSFKQQEPAPRYHARDAAIYYASLFGAKVVLGSATPSVESYYHALQGKYGLARLQERYGGLSMPEISIADTRKTMGKTRARVMISPELEVAINAALEKNHQVILFQNRRGYSPYQICNTCGWIPKCRQCDVALTFHKSTHKLHCHYCGSTYPTVTQCKACGHHDFWQENFGTQKIEEALGSIFPQARIARMDLDSVKGKHAHDQVILQFEQKRIDILVGTQMVVKGLDFDHVELVGVLDADSLFAFSDFRVNERAFQLMEQVSGRAGRKDFTGKVLIQTRNPTHPVLGMLIRHDYTAFFHSELDGRKQFAYPPYSRLIKLTVKHRQKEVAESAAAILARMLSRLPSVALTGPAEPVVNLIRGQYLMELLLKLPRTSSVIQTVKAEIRNMVPAVLNEKGMKNVVILVDVDPV